MDCVVCILKLFAFGLMLPFVVLAFALVHKLHGEEIERIRRMYNDYGSALD